MLTSVRYISVLLLIITHGILGGLAAGNLVAGGVNGIYLSVATCVAILGVVVVIFTSLVIIAELSQKQASTVSAFYELVWVAFVWIADATAASYLTSDGPPLCTNPEHPISRTWDICIVHSVMYPLSWFSAAIATTMVCVLAIVIQWHYQTESRQNSHAKPKESSSSLWDRCKELINQESSILLPIINQSVYVLLHNKADGTAGEGTGNGTEAWYAGSGRMTGKGMGVEPFTFGGKPRERDVEAAMAMDDLDLERPPSYLSQPAHARIGSTSSSVISPIIAMYQGFPRHTPNIKTYQLRDDQFPAQISTPTITVKVPSKPPSRSPLHNNVTSARDSSGSRQHSLFSTATSLSLSTQSLPRRSRTLPSNILLAPPPVAQCTTGKLDARKYPALARSRTIASSARRNIPSRYANIDLVAAGYID